MAIAMNPRDKGPWAEPALQDDDCTMTTETRRGTCDLEDAADLTSDAFLSMVLDRTSDGVVLADRDGTIVYVNRPLLELFGYAREDLIGHPVEILLPEDLRNDHRRHVDDYAKSPRPRPMGRDDLDIEGRRADGSNFPIDVQLNSLPGSTLVVATVRDMTAQRHFAADSALSKIDLARARSEVETLRESLDLVIQRLFGLGMSIAAGASNETRLTERMTAALHGIDGIIEAVQTGRGAVGPAARGTSGP